MSLLRSSAMLAPMRAGSVRAIASSAVSMAKKKEVDPSLPVPPRGPASAYTLFVKKWFTENRDSLTSASEGGKLSMKEIARQMGTAWTDLTDTAKDEYSKQAKELKSAYDKEYRSFLDGLSADSIKAIETATGKKLRIPGGKKARKAELNKASGSPGKPLTAFFEFMRDFREKEDTAGLQGRDKQIEISKRAGEKWKNMREGDKQHWRDLAAGNKAKYDEWYKTQQ